MSTGEHDSDTGGYDSALLGAYALGALDPAEARDVEEHMARCTRCREEAERLGKMTASLGEVPPEAFLDGPPDGGDLLLQRTLRQARTERRGAERRQRAALAAVAVVAAAAVLGTGVVIGRSAPAGAAPPAAAPTATAPAPSPPPAGVVHASAKDPRTGATLVVRVTPAHAWVRLSAAVAGVPAGELCRLVVVSRDGGRRIAGGWRVGSAEKGAHLDGSAAVPRGDVVAIVVESEAGETLVTTPIRT
ncbi:zf-HC2 domain-containing protein [Streptomyces sp. NPDC000594]|uniref:zf-HC2 domain-containing protein n=1 Tax=Streptomyces sp. NPDC000594 TaxID=3154261 RepID=UPI00331A00AD